MVPLHLASETTEALLRLPESGMGFQHVAARYQGRQANFLVWNCELAFELTDLDLRAGTDPSTVLGNGVRVIRELRRSSTVMMSSHRPAQLVLLTSRIGPTQSVPHGPRVASTSSLVKQVLLGANRIFYRYSAFNPDRRVDPTTGSFAPGTYAVPESEAPFVPTGFVAVGRFALPNTQPASHRYTIEASSGVSVSFGTVAPAFGQAGGGVEAFFANGVVNQQSPATKPRTIPDE